MLHNYIQQNPQIFQFGGVMSANELETLFDIQKPVISLYDTDEVKLNKYSNFNLKRVAAYGKINAIIINNGLVMKQSTDKDTKEVSYKVQTKAGTVKQIKAYKTTSTKLKKRSTVLRTALLSTL